MTLALLNARSLWGAQAAHVRVEVHLSPGLPTFRVVGMTSQAAQATSERVRASLSFTGYQFPLGRLTVNLAPADTPKNTACTDLAIALGILLATRQTKFAPDLADLMHTHKQGEQKVLHQTPHDWVFLGELSLSGMLIEVDHLLPILLTVAKEMAGAKVLLPKQQLKQLPFIPGLNIMGITGLNQACEVISGVVKPNWFKPSHIKVASINPNLLCLSDVRGQAEACRALEIAAAGGHHLLLAGSAGAGKSLLAKRLISLLPPLDAEESLEVAAIQCFVSPGNQAIWGRPMRSPHSRTTMVAMTGGGAMAMPGELTFAHRGVLILDEAAEFDRKVLDALREPIESGFVNVSRLRARVTHPAAFQLVMTTNLCPCGWYGHPTQACQCTLAIREAYQRTLSGPLLDRIDMSLTLHAPSGEWQMQPKAAPSVEIRPRIEAAQTRALKRQGCLNHALQLPQIDRLQIINHSVWAVLNEATQRFGMSTRAQLKAIRVAMSCADLDQVEQVGVDHISEALGYRLHNMVKKYYNHGLN
jgi:magnesium chelatase family protein